MKNLFAKICLSSTFALFVGNVMIGFNEPVFAANISQEEIEHIDHDLKDPKTSNRDFSKEIVELKATVDSKDAAPELRATCYRLLSGIYSGRNKAQTKLAIDAIEKAVELAPNDKDVLVQRAYAHSLDPNRKDVIELYDAAIAVNPNLGWLYFNRGSMLQGQQRHQEAIRDFDKAIALSKPDELHRKIGFILKINSLWASSKFKDVLDAARDVNVEGLPSQLKVDFYRALGYSQLRENQFHEGVETLTKALKFSENEKELALLYHFRAIGYFKLNQKDKADADEDLAEKYGYRAPNSPPPDEVVPFNQELQELLKPLIVKARASLPEAKKRFLAGLPNKHFMSVTTLLTDKKGQHEQVFVNVVSWNGEIVTGTLANDVSLEGFKRRQDLTVNEKDILDWTIVNEKGEEEGNLLGKFIDKWLDEHQK